MASKVILCASVILSLLACQISSSPQEAPAVNCWKQLAPVKNGPRQEHGVATVGKTIYVIGGTKMGLERGQDSSVEKYDLETSKWSDVAPVPQPLHHPNVATVEGKIYIVGALRGFNPTRKTLGNIYRYDPATNKWEELAPMPAGTERGSSAIAVNGSKIYIAGGLQPQMGDAYFGQRVTDIVSSYDTISGTWTTLPKIPERRDHVVGAFVGNTFYVIGGRTGDIQSFKGTVFALRPNATEWATLASMPTARGGLSAAVLGSKIYTFSGEGNPAPDSRQVFPNVESFDTIAGTWAKEPPMRVPRHGTQAISIEGVIYIAGGGLSGGGSASVATFESLNHVKPPLPTSLPVPEDDGACAHLLDSTIPSTTLPSTSSTKVNLSQLTGLTVLFTYPRTGGPDETIPDNWNAIPGARGCSPQACSFRDSLSTLRSLGVAQIYGLSTQDTAYQLEAKERLGLTYDLLSDEKLEFLNATKMPTFEWEGKKLVKRSILAIQDGKIVKVWYPVFPPDASARFVQEWLEVGQK